MSEKQAMSTEFSVKTQDSKLGLFENDVLNRNNREGKSLDTVLSEKYDINISPEILNNLKKANEDERSEILEKIFTDTRREEMIALASNDIKGRKVKYYRHMKLEAFYKLLENKEITALSAYDHFIEKDDKINEEDFRGFLVDYAMFLNIEDSLPNDWENIKMVELLNVIFPNMEKLQINNFVDNLTYENMLSFTKDNFDPKYLRMAHTGSLYQKFSDKLSLSVGGVLQERMDPGRIYVEMVMPDDKIISHPEGVKGEKEVFTEKINLYNITKTYNTEQIWEKIIMNPETEIGKYYKGIGRQSAVEEWRWNEETNDYLPEALVKR